MREIKFRCWFPAQDGIPAQMRSHNDLCLDALTKNGGAGQDETLMQFTGLKDKNGVEIYEGDIVSMHQFLFDGSEIEREYTGVVSWDGLQPSFTYTKIYAPSGEEMKSDHTSYSAEDMEGNPICCFYGLHEESFTVLGNIYQHPNLLENK